MIDKSTLPFKVSTGNYEIIASGVAHLTENEVKFELANIVIKFEFKSDGKKEARFNGEVIENELVITLYNFSNSLGEGKIGPMEIGTLQNRQLFVTFYVNTIKDNLRLFNYTFMLMEE